jgi:hypothetical protein
MDKHSRVMLGQILSALSHMQSLDQTGINAINHELVRIQRGQPPKEKKPCSGCGKSKQNLNDLKDLKDSVNAQAKNTSTG